MESHFFARSIGRKAMHCEFAFLFDSYLLERSVYLTLAVFTGALNYLLSEPSVPLLARHSDNVVFVD
jgi:hypothetical protein